MEYLPHYLAAFALTVCLTMLLRRPALSLGLVDIPGGRKRHDQPVPLIGGIVMFLSFSIIVAWLWPIPVVPYASLFAGMIILVATGMLDDRYEIPAASRFFVQVLAALLMTSWSGVQIQDLGNLFGVGELVLGDWAIPFTVICVVALINAINMADGFDGLAGGIVIMSLMWLGIVSAIAYINGVAVPLLFSLACAVAGFLVFNLRNPWRKKASVFMGDAGSMMLGFAVAWFAVYITQTPTADVAPITIAWILALPIFDATTVIIRRVARGVSPFEPARDHIHHMLIEGGLSVSATTYLLIALSLVYGAIGVSGWVAGIPEWTMFAGFLCVGGLQLWFSIAGWRILNRVRAG